MAKSPKTPAADPAKPGTDLAESKASATPPGPDAGSEQPGAAAGGSGFQGQQFVGADGNPVTSDSPKQPPATESTVPQPEFFKQAFDNMPPEEVAAAKAGLELHLGYALVPSVPASPTPPPQEAVAQAAKGPVDLSSVNPHG